MPENKKYWSHSSAIIDEGASIGRGTKIWHFCHIMPQATIGENCNLGQNVFIANKVKIGDGVKIQNNVSLYEGLECAENVFIGPSAVFTNIKNPRSEFPRQSQYRTTKIERGVTIGANATIVCGITLGQYSFIAAGAVVTQNIQPFSLVAGVPAKPIGWISKAGHKLTFEENGIAHCPETNETYALKDNMLVIHD